MVKMGVIGLGHMGGYHASICLSLPEIQLVGIADLIPKNWHKIEVAQIKKTKNYKDWLSLADAVIIAVPTQYHYSIAKDCMLAGKHVLLEKPLTRTIKEAQDLFRIAHQKKVSLHVGHVERFNAAVQQLKKIVHEPYLIESDRIGPFTPRSQNDSIILDLMIHDLDIILNLVNSPVKYFNVVGSIVKTKLNDIVVLQAKFQNGILANVLSSRTSQIKKRTMTIHQKSCFIQLDFTTQDISIHSRATDSFKIGSNELHYKQKGTVQRLFVYKDNPLKLEIQHFINSIKTNANLINADQDIQALKLALEIEEKLSNNT